MERAVYNETIDVSSENRQSPGSMARSSGRVLIVDDEKNARDALAELLGDEHVTQVAADGASALAAIESFDPDVVLTDLKMPGIDGIELVRRGRKVARHAAFVVMTAFGSVESAVRALKEGADNYLTKPLDLDSVSALVNRALEKAALSREAASLRKRIDDKLVVGNLVGAHPSMQRLFKVVRQVAKSRATVLIQGESGTGKELVAEAIHHASPRSAGPFVRLNCAALVETLLESELFGHERGSFTGATARRQGRFEEAHRGTLFLDEVSEISLPVQVKLLRFLQERKFERVGGNETIEVDVRVVVATNRDLRVRVEEGHFREDLFYRLNVVQLDIPPLRARRSDIPALAHHFVRKYCKDNDVAPKQLSECALSLLMAHPWPGNVRELENTIERAVVLCDSDKIQAQDLQTSAVTGGLSPSGGALDLLVPGISLAELERVAIERTLDAVNGSTARAAEILGISRRKIQYRLKQWSSERPPDPDAA